MSSPRVSSPTNILHHTTQYSAMAPSDNRSSIMTRASAPPPRNDSPAVSPSPTSMLRTVGPNCEAPPSFPTPVTPAGRGSPVQRHAVGRLPGPDHPHPSPDSSRAPTGVTPRQQETPLEEWAKPTFLRDRVTSLDRCLSTVSALVQKQADDDKETNPLSFFSKLTEVAGDMKADLKSTRESIKASVNAGIEDKLAEIRQQIKADGKEVLDQSVLSLRQQIKADQEEAIQRTITMVFGETIVKGLNERMDELTKEVRGMKAIGDVQPTPATVADDLSTTIAHARHQLGLPKAEVALSDFFVIPSSPPLGDDDDDGDDNVQLRRPLSGHEVSTTFTVHTNTSGADIPSIAAAYSEIIQSSTQVTADNDVPAGPDVPTTPTTPTISDASSARTGRSSALDEARAFLATLHETAKLYGYLIKSKTNLKRRT